MADNVRYVKGGGARPPQVKKREGRGQTACPEGLNAPKGRRQAQATRKEDTTAHHPRLPLGGLA